MSAATSQPPRGAWKICIASRAPFVGGAEVAAERLAVGLRQAGLDVFFLLGQQGAVQERLAAAGLRCLVAPLSLTDKWRWWRWLASERAAQRIFQAERPTLVHSNDLPTHQMVSRAAGRLGIARICHHRFFFDPAAADWLNKYGAEQHVFVSRALMDDLCGGSERIRRSSRDVVYDGLPLPSLPSADERQRIRDRLGLPLQGTVVTFAGQIVERKGVADLLHAWNLLDHDLANGAQLLIIGDDLQGQGKYRLEMERLARELGSPARFVGFQKDVGDWLSASDIAVVPSHVEPLGNATLEAMAHALPVIGSAVGGIPEMIEHERSGLLVPPRSPGELAAALRRLLGDASLRENLGNQARRVCAERFSLEAHVRAVLAVYETVLQRTPVTR